MNNKQTMKRTILSASLIMAAYVMMAQKQITVTVSNAANHDKTDAPIVLKLDKYTFNVKSALVTEEGTEVPDRQAAYIRCAHIR